MSQNEILGFELKIGKSRWGARLEFLRVTVRFLVLEDVCRAHLPIAPNRAKRLTDEIEKILESKSVFRAQIRKLAGELNCAQTSAI